MSVYNQVLLYTFRDSLASGDPNKTIKGAYLDGEFGAIHTASLDAASLSLTNLFTGTNTFSGASVTTTFSGAIVAGAPTAGTIAITATGVANSYAEKLIGSSTSGQSLGLLISAGTTGADRALTITNQAATHNYLLVNGDGSFNLGFNGSSTTITGIAAGNVTISAPSSGVPLTINGTTGGGGFLAGQVTSNSFVTLDITNASTGTAGAAYFRAINSTDSLQMGITSTGLSGSFLSGGPSGEQAFVAGSGNFPLSIGTSQTERIRIAGGGAVTINASGGTNTLTVNAGAGAYCINLNGSSSSGNSLGLQIFAGTTGADGPLNIFTQGATPLFSIGGTGKILGGATTGVGGPGTVDMTPDKGTFTATWGGFSAAPATTAIPFVRMGNTVILTFPGSNTGTSNASSFTMSGLPAQLQPTHAQLVPLMGLVDNGGLVASSFAYIPVGSVINFGKLITDGVTTDWTGSGTKGFSTAFSGYTLTYSIG